MARRRLAFAAVLPPADGGRQHPSKQSGGRRDRRPAREPLARSSPAIWTELEEAFFAAAPPDDPPPAPQPESFDDLGGTTPAAGSFRAAWDAMWAGVRRLFSRPPKSVPHRS